MPLIPHFNISDVFNAISTYINSPNNLNRFDRTADEQTKGRQYQNDPLPYTSRGGNRAVVSSQPYSTAPQCREDVQFKYFAQSKCFALIDDTPSMRSSWSQTRDALTGVVKALSSGNRWDGLDVEFLHETKTYPSIKTAEEFVHVFDSVTLTGGKAMTAKVSRVFKESLPLIQGTSTARHVALLIITDGIAADAEELSNAIVRFCRTLNSKRIPSDMFTIHILQMGNDRGAVQPLHDFRDRLIQRVPDRDILNVVSYHRGRGLLNADDIIKLLLASTNIPFSEDPEIGERLPPEAIRAQYETLDTIRAMGSSR